MYCADAILSYDICKRGNFSDGISPAKGNDFEGNDMCNDWVESFCEYYINDQLDGSVCHLAEMDEKFLGIFSVSIFDGHGDDL